MTDVGERFAALDAPRDLLEWEIVVPIATWSPEFERILDSHGNALLVLEDTWELIGNDGSIPKSQRDLVGELSRSGFTCPIRIPTTFPASLGDVAEMWLEANEECGIRVVPIVQREYFGARVNRRITSADVAGAVAAIERLTQRVAGIVHLCEPWRSILLWALTPAQVRESFRESESSLFLSKTGRWARSQVHADCGFFSDFDSVLPAAAAPGSVDVVADDPNERSVPDATSGWPDCGSCGFAPLCSKYWTAEVDSHAKSGNESAAVVAADLACRVRMTVLGTLIDEWRLQVSETTRREPVEVVFRDGVVSYVESRTATTGSD